MSFIRATINRMIEIAEMKSKKKSILGSGVNNFMALFIKGQLIFQKYIKHQYNHACAFYIP